MADLPRRPLGRTGVEVSVLGFGAWGIGGGVWGPADEAESLRALRLAIDSGVNFIDTALAYGPHQSERLVGLAVRASRDPVYVATKAPPKNLQWPARSGTQVSDAFPAEHVRHCVERSLRNLGTETIDLFQLHVWRDEWLHEGDWQETIAELRQEGKIRHFGISTNDHEPGNAVAIAGSGVVDAVQVIYNVFEQAPEDELLPVCQRGNVGVIARVPFDEGGLTGQLSSTTEFPPGDFRASYFAGDRRGLVRERVDAIMVDLGVSEADMADLALRFVLSHPAVSTTIAGMRSTRNVERNLMSASRPPLAPGQLEALARHRWAKNFYAPPSELAGA